MKYLIAVFLLALGIGAAMAADTVVNVSWGDALASFFYSLSVSDAAIAAFFAVMAWIVAKLPKPLSWAFRVFKVDQLLLKALQAALNTTAGAVAGKALDVNVGSEVLARAVQYAIDNGQQSVIDFMGGRDGIQQKLIARMKLDATVNGGALVAKAADLEGLSVTG